LVLQNGLMTMTIDSMITDHQVNPSLLSRMHCNTGESVQDISSREPIMLIFLRHFGCMFCKEALAEISENRSSIEAQGVTLIFVHMSPFEVADRYFEKFKLNGVIHVSDPECRYYTAFGLMKGNFSQLFGLRVWMRGFSGPLPKGYLPEQSKTLGDSFQMPGVFVIHDNFIKSKYVHKLASDRPDYVELAECCSTNLGHSEAG
jgi:peroxiredoxin